MSKISSNLAQWLQKQQKYTLISISVLLVIVTWGIDYATGPYLSTSILYLVPVSFAAWWLNKRIALGISLLSAILWLLTDIYTNPITPNPLIPYWNASVRLGFFFVVTLALSSLHDARKRQEETLSFLVHDLRSPLSNILMSMNFLKETDAIPDPAMKSLVDLSITSGQRMLIQINSMLDLGQLESKKLQVVKSDVQVKALLQQAMNQVASLAERKQVKLQVEGVTDDLFVWADESLTLRILVNLLSNAVKFSPDNCPVRVQAQPNNGSLSIAVHDQGPGIPVKWQRQVFNKYEQIQVRKSGAATGSGLGLAFCKAAVEAQNGRIWLDAPVNKPGTIISFTLPLSTINKQA